MIRVVISALLFCLAFQYAYESYIYPTYAYAHFRYFPQTVTQYILNYVLVALPLAAWRPSEEPSAFGVCLIYAVCYIPIQVMVPFMLDQAYSPVLLMQMAICGSMALLFLASRSGAVSGITKQPVDGRLNLVIMIFAGAALVLLVATNFQIMRLVSFADVYDLRLDASDQESIGAVQYLSSWLSYCFLPFFIARGIISRHWASLAIGLTGCLLVYLSSGAKSVILMPLIMLVMWFVLKARKDFLSLLLSGSAAATILVLFLPDDSLLSWGKSVLLMRTFAVGGWTVSLYYEYFSANEYTYYSHIRFIDMITQGYPYGARSLGQMIGIEYSGSDLANFNANFWASDGLAALGLWGIPVVTGILCGFLILVNRASSYFDSEFISLWMSGFWLALLNVPLSTAILSGGGGLIVILLWISRLQLPDIIAARGKRAPASEESI